MKLSCPNCGAGFEVRAEALGPTGRKVRCSACSYQWTARATAVPAEAVATVAEPAPAAQAAPEPPPPVLVETTLSPLEPAPPEPPPEPEVEPPDIEALREAAILRPSPPTPRPPAAQADEAEITPPPDGPPPTRAEIQPPRHRGAIVGWVLFALVLIALGGAVWKREQVMAAFPQTREIFRLVGFNILGPADGLDLVSPQVTWSRIPPDSQPLLIVQGAVKNVSSGPREIPPLRAILRNGTVEVQSWTFRASAERVEAGGEVPYRFEIRAPPPSGTTIAVVFSAAE
jgi:predicted Zn finger-like uncharacterized protein